MVYCQIRHWGVVLLREEKKNRRVPVKLLAAVAAAQIFFWLVYNPIFVQPETGPFESIEISDFTIANLKAPTSDALSSADYKTVRENELSFFEVGYYSIKSSFQIDEIPESGLGLWGRVPSDSGRLFLNGQFLYGEGDIELPDVTYHKLSYELIHIPPSMLVSGKNNLEVIMTYDIAREALITRPLIGEYRSIAQAYQWRNLLRSEGRAITVAIGFTLALFILVALIRAEKRALLFWLFSLTILWALQNMFHIWAQIPLQGNARGLYYSLITLLLSACWPIFVDEWTERPRKYFQYTIFLVLAVSLLAAIYWMMLSGDVSAFTQVESILDWSGMLFIAAVMIRLIWHFLAVDDQRNWEAALLITLAMLVAVQRINFFLWGVGPPYFELSQPLFLLTFAVAYFSRNFRLFQSSKQINTLLQSQLNTRTAELETAHARETQFVRQQALDEERQRIMRDMHDGLGSNLMSMLMMAKRGKAKHDEYAEGLQLVIDEMRLMIDSMDSVGESLRAALAIFKKRVVPRARNAGFAVTWSNTADDIMPDYGPRDVLQIFRILQEAITNALKHSGGDAIDIAILPSSDPQFAMRITVADNGGGLVDPQQRGRGLSNMKNRANGIDAELSVQDNKQGVEVVLELPVRTGQIAS